MGGLKEYDECVGMGRILLKFFYNYVYPYLLITDLPFIKSEGLLNVTSFWGRELTLSSQNCCSFK